MNISIIIIIIIIIYYLGIVKVYLLFIIFEKIMNNKYF